MEKLGLEPVNFQKYLTCGRCFLVIDNPYEIECCGTLFCYSCIQNILSNKEIEICDKCQKIAKFSQNSFVKRIINGLEIDCNFGCGKKFYSNEIKSHMISCDLREYMCFICSKKGIEKNQNGSVNLNICGIYDKNDKSDKEINIPNEINFYNSQFKFRGNKKEFLKHLILEHESEILNFNDNFFNLKNIINNPVSTHCESDIKKKTQFLSVIEEAKENNENNYSTFTDFILRREATSQSRIPSHPIRMDSSLRSFDNYSQYRSSYYTHSEDNRDYD